MHRPLGCFGTISCSENKPFPSHTVLPHIPAPRGNNSAPVPAAHLPDQLIPLMVPSHPELSAEFMAQSKHVALGFPPSSLEEGGVIAFATSAGTPRSQGKRAIILIYKQVGNLFSHALKNHCAIGAGCAD